MTSIENVVKHEEERIDRRVGWMLAFQGFLFFAISKVFDKGFTLDIQHQTKYMLVTFCILGIINSSLTLASVHAAYQEMKKKRAQSNEGNFGASGFNKYLGRASAIGMPISLASAWLYLLLVFL